jgi:hypothetical protein
MDAAGAVAGNTSTPLTPEQATQEFQQRASLLTPPQEHENASEPPAPDAETTPSPEDRPEVEAEQSADAEPEAQSEEPELFAVPGPDGKELKVTLEELRGGYLRQADYTRKRQAQAEAEKQTAAETQAAREQRTQYQEQLGQLKTALESLTPPEPKRDQFEDPNEYAVKRLEWNEHQDRLKTVTEAQQRVAWEAAQDKVKQHNARVAEENDKLLLAIPEWKDAAKAKGESEKMWATAKAYGFTDDLIGQIDDHRTLLVLRDAMRYRELQAKKPEAQRRIQQVKSATPGGLKAPVQGAGYKRALDQLAKSGRQEDAALAFQQLGASGKTAE